MPRIAAGDAAQDCGAESSSVLPATVLDVQRLTSVVAFAVLLLAVAVSSASATDPSNPYAEQPAPCIVPVLAGKTLQKAKPAIVKAGCKLGVVRKKVARKALVGRVISQAPAPRKRVKRGASVSITLGRAAP